jgi:hypothetical protein
MPAIPEWPEEVIPDDNALYMRVHKTHVQNGVLLPGVFRDVDGGMSVNWQKYCATAAAARRLAKNPKDNGVISFARAGDIRSIPTKPALQVEHKPDFEKLDRSHSEVFGDKKAAGVRVALLKLLHWEIPIEAAVE